MTDRKDAATAAEEEARKLAGSDAEALDTKTQGGLYTHVFEEPVQFEGETFEKLTFDFGKIRGRDIRAVKRELRLEGTPVLVASLDDDYLIRICAKACTRPLYWGVFDEMAPRDYNRILSVSKRFF